MRASTDRAPKDAAVARLGVLAWVGMAVALYLVLFVARTPAEDQGFCLAPCEIQRIFYFHVPSAWVAYLSFAVVFIGSLAFLRTNAGRWDLLARSAAETGVLFTTLVLVTGPIWARPVWGTWWQWDARLTSSLVMWMTYVGYLLLRGLTEDPQRAGRLAAVAGIIGFVNVPIVHFSVQWWRTLHPSGPTVADLESSSGLGSPELVAFFTSLIAFTLVFAWLIAARVRVGVLEERLVQLELRAP